MIEAHSAFLFINVCTKPLPIFVYTCLPPEAPVLLYFFVAIIVVGRVRGLRYRALVLRGAFGTGKFNDPTNGDRELGAGDDRRYVTSCDLDSVSKWFVYFTVRHKVYCVMPKSHRQLAYLLQTNSLTLIFEPHYAVFSTR
jgi:hypothetical protein